MSNHQVVSRQVWLEARKALLIKEKELTRLGDGLSRERRALPWVRLEKDYLFDTVDGGRSLGDLFEGRSQLLVYHFMFGPDWKEGCKSCSFWADNFNGIPVHLAHRDVSFLAVSRAPLEKLQAYRRRMGWSFNWVSSLNNGFNWDFGVSFTPAQMEKGEVCYNYAEGRFPSEEAPGVSVFYRDREGVVYHTYSCYSRGLDILNGAYHYLDLTPKGRDEDGLPYSMAWLQRHDDY